MKTNDKTIKVTMDNYDLWVQDGFKIRKGDNVVVTGRVDNDLFEKKTLNAGGVFVKNINSYFHAESSDKSYNTTPAISSSYLSIKNLPDNTSADITGKVTNIRGREFTVDTGWRKVQVDTAKMGYNPLDNLGLTKIKKGDRVTVSGVVDNSYFDDKELSANYIIEHSDTSLYSE
jgi:hypothetical protein